MKNNIKEIKQKKEIINELLVDPVTFQYAKDDKRNTDNDNEISASKTTDQLSTSVSEPKSNLIGQGYSTFFFYEDREVKTEEVLKKTELKDILDGDNDQIEDKILQIIDNITDEFNEKEKYELMLGIINKFDIKNLDDDLLSKLITKLKHVDNIL